MPRGVAKAGRRKVKPLLETLAEKVALTDDNHLLWLGAKADGYGYFIRRSLNGKPRERFLTHRVAYELLVGPIPEGLDIDHTCYIRDCCAPWCLEPVTKAENTRRGYQYRREGRGRPG